MNKKKSNNKDYTKPRMTFAEGMELLRQAEKYGSPPPDDVDTLPIESIGRMVAVFQPRGLWGSLIDDQSHIDTLAAAIGSGKTPKMLDPLTVWWSGKEWLVIDGHHRLEAYKRVLGEEAFQTHVPIKVFKGSFDDAYAVGAEANSKDKLPMRLEDKLNRAWRMTCITNKSKAEVSNACSIAPRTVSNMRTCLKKLLGIEDGQEINTDEIDRDKLIELAEWTWRRALMEASGRTGDDQVDLDEKFRLKIVNLAKRLKKSIDLQVLREPELLAEAITLLDSRTPPRLIASEAWKLSREALMEEILADLQEEALMEDQEEMSQAS